MEMNNKIGLAERIQFLGVDERNRENLRALKSLMERELPKGLDSFYDKIKRTPETSKFFSSDAHMTSAKAAQIQHWQSILNGSFDENYGRHAEKIGKVHAQIGLEPKWYIGGYALILEHLIGCIVKEHCQSDSGGFLSRSKNQIDPEKLSSVLASLIKAVFLDMDIAISVYGNDTEASERRRAMNEAIESERNLVVETFGTALSRIAAKDLRYRIQDDLPDVYESLKHDFNNAVEELEGTVELIGQSAVNMAAGSNEINSAAGDLAKGAEAQAASVGETASAVEQITSSVKTSTERAEEVGKLVSHTRQSAEESGTIVNRAVTAMDKIEKSSAEIANIIGVIDEIAFQTNLLALNAGVEAARAGDAGKGFAVVAQEVRELAQRSANAAKDIKNLITASGNEVNAGVSLVNETGQALEKIVTEVQEVAEHVTAIVESAREQSVGLSQVNVSVGSIDQGTQKIAAMAEETTAATHSLTEEVSKINEMLGAFSTSGTVQGVAPGLTVATSRNTTVASPARTLTRHVASAMATGTDGGDSGDWKAF